MRNRWRECLRKLGVLFNIRTAAMFVPEEDGAVQQGAGVRSYDMSSGLPA